MKIRIRKRYLFYILAFSSAIIAALVSGLDTISQFYIPDPLALGVACFMFGVIISIIFSLFFSIKIKGKTIGQKTVDPSFQGARLLRKQELKYQLLAGGGNAVMTIGYFMLLSITGGNVSVVLPFSQVVIMYLVVIESFDEKDTPTLIEIQSAVIVTFGAILGSLAVTGGINQNFIQTLLVVFLIINPGWVLLSIYQRKLKLLKFKDRPNDAINIRLWNVIFACLITSIIVIAYDIFSVSDHFMQGLVGAFKNYFWVGLMAVGTFFNFIFYIRALGIGKASTTQAVKASTIVFSIPVAILMGCLGFTAPFTSNPIEIILKIMGIILIMLGIMTYAFTLTKAYIFIHVKPGYSVDEMVKKLWKIKGVNRVTAVAGHYDIIMKIRTRTLVKGYERILRKVEEVPGIDRYRWQSVLKEWEDI